MFAVLVLLSIPGCEVLPTLEFRAEDQQGQPVAALPVLITSSQRVELVHFPADLKPGEIREVEEKDRHRVDGVTDEKGAFTVAYVPPEKPGFFARLFGAEVPREEWIEVTHKDKTGMQVTSKVLIPAR